MLWELPREAVQGILNGMEPAGRPSDLSGDAPDFEAFFSSKASAKLAVQLSKGLLVGIRGG